MKPGWIPVMVVCGLLACVPSYGETDLAVLPRRASVRLTIYNSADLTLVRETRFLTLKKGANRLRFSWEGTLIDPTSLDLRPGGRKGGTGVASLSFPPRVNHQAVWNVRSAAGGRTPVEISYLTSGLSWKALYLAVLDPGEKRMALREFLRVSNMSGEDYENAQVRVIVGRINLIDRIVELARRAHPYGRPGGTFQEAVMRPETARAAKMEGAKGRLMMADKVLSARPKEIRKEGVSEYFLYSIEGEETILSGCSGLLPGFRADDVPVVNVYRYERERYGDNVMRFLEFRNDARHGLGKTPIPGGVLNVYRKTGDTGRLSHEGRCRFGYVPVDEKAVLGLGPAADVIVRPKLTACRTGGYLFDRHGNISGWDETREYRIRVKNTRRVAVRVEIRRNFGAPSWDLKRTGKGVTYEKIDVDTVQFTLELPPRTEKTFGYVLILHHGKRAG